LSLPTAIALAELVVIVLLVLLALRLRHRYQAIKLKFRTPMPSVLPRDFDPRFRETEIGPTLDAEVTLVGCGSGSFASTSDTEAWVLGVLARGCQQVFEFGTATGRTTYVLARNTGPQGKISTLTLASDQVERYQQEGVDSGKATFSALRESRYQQFLYAGTDVEHRVQQLYGDSKQFDETPFAGRCDLIFIDGSHAYSYIKSDSEKALRMLKPGGAVLWHDYRGPHVRPARDVFRYLNELSRSVPLKHLRGTSLVAYRSPAKS
jgi:predicted O-methyltransferase YrrM